MNFISRLSEDIAVVLSAINADEAKSKLGKAILAIMTDPVTPETPSAETPHA
jgi:hypothetical protein